MKKIIVLLLIAAICLFSFAGCGKKEKANFEFYYEIADTQYSGGEVIELTAYIKNISGKIIAYTGSSGDFFPWIELYCVDADGKVICTIEHDAIPFPTDVVEKWIKNGSVGSKTYYFTIPEDAACGVYSIRLSHSGESCVFDGVLEIVEK